ncbi:hypothetical protein PWT90_02929 [Aphanocladium album]|nr:hypothetical protein PWT90_02929 [Aphanocladium album]
MPEEYACNFKPFNPFPVDIVTRAQAELDNLATILENEGIRVYRPKKVDWLKVGGYTGAMPRDALMTVGSSVIESPFAWKCRRHEVELGYADILSDLSRGSGSGRICRAPLVLGADTLYEGLCENQQGRQYNGADSMTGQYWAINNSRPAFDTADFMRFGDTIIGQLSNVTNQRGVDYLRAVLPDGYTLEILDVTDEHAMHIDATLLPLRRGILVYNPERVTEDGLRRHAVFEDWQLFAYPFVPQARDSTRPPMCMCSPWLVLNALSIDEKRILIEENDTEFADCEIPNDVRYNEDPTGHQQVRSYHHMLSLFNVIMTEFAPTWNMDQYAAGLLGLPFTAIVAWPMATSSGRAFFMRKEVNKKLKVILDTWRDDLLMTSKSLHVVNTKENGWLCRASLEALECDANVDSLPWCSFAELFQCDPDRDPVHWGFRSWDDFFTRQFRDINKSRPVTQPDRDEWVAIITRSKEMLGNHALSDSFVGGTVFQGFLTLTSYHRWCSPVSGHVVATRVINGTYFSEPASAGFDSALGPDPSGPDRSQVYITQVATRALIFIEAPQPIGLMCAIFVGMSDVSSCEIATRFQVDNPTPVCKGEEIGTFRHGGSSYCLLFRNGLKLAWVPEAIPREDSRNLQVRSELAHAYTD